MYFSSIQTQQKVYSPHDILASVSNSGLKSLSFKLSLANALRLTGLVLGRGTHESAFVAGKLSVSDLGVP
jgi:hypothetical protein